MCQFFLRVWLGEKLHPGVKPPVMDDRVSGIAGGEEDGQIRSQGGRLERERPPVHALGQNDVSEQDVNSFAVVKRR